MEIIGPHWGTYDSPDLVEGAPFLQWPLDRRSWFGPFPERFHPKPVSSFWLSWGGALNPGSLVEPCKEDLKDNSGSPYTRWPFPRGDVVLDVLTGFDQFRSLAHVQILPKGCTQGITTRLVAEVFLLNGPSSLATDTVGCFPRENLKGKGRTWLVSLSETDILPCRQRSLEHRAK